MSFIATPILISLAMRRIYILSYWGLKDISLVPGGPINQEEVSANFHEFD